MVTVSPGHALQSDSPGDPVTAATRNGEAATNALLHSRSRISTHLPDEPKKPLRLLNWLVVVGLGVFWIVLLSR